MRMASRQYNDWLDPRWLKQRHRTVQRLQNISGVLNSVRSFFTVFLIFFLAIMNLKNKVIQRRDVGTQTDRQRWVSREEMCAHRWTDRNV